MSLAWRKNDFSSVKQKDSNETQKFCEELVSSHGVPDNEVKLWQINKYQKNSSGKENSELKTGK